MSTKIDCYGDSIIGDRKSQQDAYAIADWDDATSGNGLLICVADGMGGHEGGAEASRLAVTHGITAFLEQSGSLEERLQVSVLAANKSIADARHRYTESDKSVMGCTYVLVAIDGNQCYWVSVGDSLVMLSRNRDVQRLNRDHSMRPIIDQMIVNGELTQEEATKDSRSSMLRSALQGKEIKLIDINGISLSANDRLCVASDGIMALESALIKKRLIEETTPERQVRQLIAEVQTSGTGSLDNTTIVVFEMKSDRSVGSMIRKLVS